MSTVASSNRGDDSDSSEEVDWDTTEDGLGDDDDDDVHNPGNSARHANQETFRQLNEFDIDKATRACFIQSQNYHNRFIQDGIINIIHTDDLLSDQLLANI